MKARTLRTKGSVFADLGFPRGEAEHLKVRSDLMIELTKLTEYARIGALHGASPTAV